MAGPDALSAASTCGPSSSRSARAARPIRTQTAGDGVLRGGGGGGGTSRGAVPRSSRAHRRQKCRSAEFPAPHRGQATSPGAGTSGCWCAGRGGGAWVSPGGTDGGSRDGGTGSGPRTADADPTVSVPSGGRTGDGGVGAGGDDRVRGGVAGGIGETLSLVPTTPPGHGRGDDITCVVLIVGPASGA